MTVTVPAAGDSIDATWGIAVSDWLNDRTGITAATASITNTQVKVHSLTIPASSLAVGDIFRVTAYGVMTSSAANACTFRVRVGTTTLTGNIAANTSPVATTTASGHSFAIEAMVTVRTIGASGTVIGAIVAKGTGPAIQEPFSDSQRTQTETATVVVDSTVANLIELTAVAAAGTTSMVFHQAAIERVSAP